MSVGTLRVLFGIEAIDGLVVRDAQMGFGRLIFFVLVFIFISDVLSD